MIPTNQFESEIIEYAIYWHHPKAKRFEDPTTQEILSQVNMEEVKSFLSELGFDCLDLPIQGVIPPHLYFSYDNDIDKQSYKNIALNVIIEADRGVSSLTPKELESYLSGNYFFEAKEQMTQTPKLIDNSDRTNKQW
jgi:hypothetical protein